MSRLNRCPLESITLGCFSFCCPSSFWQVSGILYGSVLHICNCCPVHTCRITVFDLCELYKYTRTVPFCSFSCNAEEKFYTLKPLNVLLATRISKHHNREMLNVFALVSQMVKTTPTIFTIFDLHYLFTVTRKK
jgi:hypothetical protein